MSVDNKLRLCVLPTQMGKTFVIIKNILEVLKTDTINGRSIHIVFTMNTLLNNKQFANRLEDINKEYGENSVCVFASKYKGTMGHIDCLWKLVSLSDNPGKLPRIVIACSNSRRFQDCFNYIQYIEKNKSIVSRSFVYFDEIHKYIKDSKNKKCMTNIRKKIEAINDYKIVHGMIGMTATPNNLWIVNANNDIKGFWKSIHIVNIEKHTDINYAGCNDIVFHINKYCEEYDSTKDVHCGFGMDYKEVYTFTYSKYILKKYPEILRDKARVFIPAHNKRVSHQYMRDFVYTMNKKSIVIMLNGEEKNVKYYRGTELITHDIQLKEGELGDYIAEFIEAKGLLLRPVVFIGYMCVGMGQTLVSERLGPFTAAIFCYNVISNDSLYQLFGRVTGRIKHWSSYQNKTEVYCPSYCKKICELMEECALNVIKKYNGKNIDKVDYIEPMNDDPAIISNFNVKACNFIC
jgi:hypothetical protein